MHTLFIHWKWIGLLQSIVLILFMFTYSTWKSNAVSDMWEPMVDVFGIKPATTCLQVPYLMNKISLYTYIYTSSTQQRHTSSVILWVWRCGDKLDELCSCLCWCSWKCLLPENEVNPTNQPKQDTVQPWSSTQHKDQLPELRAVSTKATSWIVKIMKN